jgi:branched-subunit amino acid transport protein
MSGFEAGLIAGMALVTFLIRYSLFAVGQRVRFSSWLTEALGFVPVAVLTAIIVPAMLFPDGATSMQLSLDNAYLIGGLAAMAIAAWFRNLLATVIVGLAVFFLWRWWLG